MTLGRAALVAIARLGLLAPAASPASAQDWPEWRGPGRDGVAAGFLAPKTWPASLRVIWQAPVGVGHSSPVVAAGRVYLFVREGDDEVVSSFELGTGRRLWRQGYLAPYSLNWAASSHGKGPKSTPVLRDGRLCTLGIGGGVACFEAATGRPLWRKEFGREFAQPSPLYGGATSPAVEGGLLLVHVGGHEEGAMTAFDAATGEVRWAARGEGPSYASPVVATLAGTRQVVTQTRTHLAGFSAAAGERLWQLPFTTEYDQNAVTPVVDGDLVVYSGLDKAVRAVRVVKRGRAFAAEFVWENADVSLYLSSPVVSGGRLYGLSHRRKGQFFCLDARTGRTLWLSEGRQGESASILVAAEHLLLLTTEGRLTALRRDAAAFAPQASYTLSDSPVWAHPALAGQTLLVKDADRLTAWRFE